MRRHVGRRTAQQRAAVERHRLAGRAHEVRRRHPRTGIAGAPAEHHPRGGHGVARSRHHGRRARRHRFHARSRTARIAARGGLLHQGTLHRAQHPDGRGEPPAGAHPLALHRPARPYASPPGFPVPVPARERRTHADRACRFAARDAHHRHDDRRCRRRSVRQVRQGDGTPLPGRTGDRPSGQGG